MSLLDDLRSLDISGIVTARGSLTAAINIDDIASVTQNGGPAAALGDLGRNLGQFRASFPDAESLFRALIGVLENLAPQLDLSRLPIGPYAAAVREGAGLAANILAAFKENPSEWGSGLGRSLGEALQLVGG